MLTLQDCIELSELSEEEILAIAEHEHLPEMVAVEMGNYLTHTASGERKAYPSLAVIQLGFLMDHGALRWDPAATAANGKDTGAFTIVTDKLVPAIDEMIKVVGGIKARGDREAAEALLTRYVDGDLVPQAVIAERMLRAPKTSFVYAVER